MTERMEEPRDPEAAPDPWTDGPSWSDAPADPWADSPVWSDGSTGPSPAPGSSDQPEAAASQPAPDDAPPACPWCGTQAAPGASKCPACGAALAQRESIGDLVVPGLTAVDPALKDLADRPLHLAGPSPTHGVASGVIAAAAMGGPVGLAIIGGVGAVAATEYLGANRTGADGVPLDQVGQASDAVLQAIDKLERGEELPSADSTTPRPELEGNGAPGAEPATEEEKADGGD